MSRKPNFILVITDDQGYGDLGCTGNPWISTPHIDAFYQDAVRLEDFHVQPLCAPTRSALLSGHRPLRNGVWATCWGRSILRPGETTMADIFQAGGYRTGMFGKWHLGDNYPYRPQDRGFERVVAHKGGGVGQTPDFWGNNYFDDTYFHNGKPARHFGYCTDVWFEEAMKFIQEDRETPFFAYIATNAPHSPYLVEERYTAPYAGNPDIPHPEFYGMIACIDENFGKLRRMLQQTGREENTILVFMTDNGSSGGCRLDRQQFLTKGYNAGMRGQKASYYDGGHRVPFFLRWPGGGMVGGRDVEEMCLDVDLLPTLAELCELPFPEALDPDGTSLAALLQGEIRELPGDRLNFIQYDQNTNPPPRERNTVMSRQWRLVYGKELYDIKKDPGQTRDVSGDHPEVVQRLLSAHDRWWKTWEPYFGNYSPISLGHDAENPTRLDAMDVMGDVAWNQVQVAMALKSSGKWTVKVERPGTYRFSLRRWPEELGIPIDAGISDEEMDKLASYQPNRQGSPCQVLKSAGARLRIFRQDHYVKVTAGDLESVFLLPLDQAGVTVLEAGFIDPSGEEQGAYYVYAERLPDTEGSGGTQS
ncbi:MAG TPA: Cerebroside-sulfatase [Clostridiales bacterium]|nr:Cerebroside-sulfatase [Clostridiales bacterium]